MKTHMDDASITTTSRHPVQGERGMGTSNFHEQDVAVEDCEGCVGIFDQRLTPEVQHSAEEKTTATEKEPDEEGPMEANQTSLRMTLKLMDTISWMNQMKLLVRQPLP